MKLQHFEAQIFPGLDHSSLFLLLVSMFDISHVLPWAIKISELYGNLPEVMKKIVNRWTNNQTYIFAVEVRKEEISNL